MVTTKSDRARTPWRKDGSFPVEGSKYPVRSVKVDEFDLGKPSFEPVKLVERVECRNNRTSSLPSGHVPFEKLRVLVVDVSLHYRTAEIVHGG